MTAISLSPARLPLARLAFRPFFLLAALFGMAALLVWLAFWHGDILLRPLGGMLWWHQHEMLFGFAAAVVAGFLLTAVQNWTGRPSLRGWPLLGLVALWLAGRGLLAFPQGLPPALIAAVDLLFLPLVAAVLARLVIAARRWRNLVFLPALGLLTLANLAMHLGVANGDAALVRQGAHLAVLLIAGLMVVLGGRVIPMFTANRLGRPKPAPCPRLEGLTLGSLLALVLVQLAVMAGAPLPGGLHAGLLGLAALANGLRLARWGGHRTLGEPLLWSLHASYAAIPLGLAMWALAALGAFRVELAVHALTIGGMGTMMLAMMARVSLGHTGRPIACLPGIGVALGMLLVAAVVRAPVLALFPAITHLTYSLGIILWCLAYAIFLLHYVVPLTTPRVDGQDG
ncbi:NnrS family protein [Halomonas koreensis]|uniref:NnrS family protein n=1 Tax=Halomonas koreensis TaxID=245385 RepID=A0ABU1G1N9_9GAMM|nr:NnrS family protein [Halomonas koreensis]MDR5866852.1 NnrS family protein [Halomonas koreensis]